MTLPVVVIGAHTTALSCIRLVARAGHKAYAACPNGSIPSRTRYYRPCITPSNERWQGELGQVGLDFLRALDFEQCVLIPTADDAALWLSQLPDDLKTRYHVSTSSYRTMLALQEKSSFAKLLAELDIPAPHSEAVSNEKQLQELPLHEGRHFFLKPVDSQAFSARFQRKAIWIENHKQAVSAWQEVSGDGFEMIIQEYISGRADNHYFIDGFRDRDGVVRARTARQRLRMYPTDFGNSSYCVSTDFENVLPAWDYLSKILVTTEYRGIFSAEFKRDERDGRFKILEINTRPWVYINFADTCGMNMCKLYVDDALEQPMSSMETYEIGLGCVNIYSDLSIVRRMPRERRPALLRLFIDWCRATKMMFSWRDPYPAVMYIGEQTKSWLLRRLRRR